MNIATETLENQLTQARELNESLLYRLAASAAREGILRDTVKLNHEFHIDNQTYLADDIADLTGMREVNLKALDLPNDDIALKLVLQMQGDFVERVRHFNKIAGNTDDVFNVRQIAIYTGMQCEELAEKLEHLGLLYTSRYLNRMATELKAGDYDYVFTKVDRVKLLEDDVDQIVVTIGSMLSQGAGIHGAFAEVHRANMGKVWPDGTMHRDENGKVMKPEGWESPDLSPFVCKITPDSPTVCDETAVINIVLNGCGIKLHNPNCTIRHDTLCRMADVDIRSTPTVTYSLPDGQSGSIVRGQVAPILDGAIYNVFVTGSA